MLVLVEVGFMTKDTPSPQPDPMVEDLDKIFYQALRGKTVTKEQRYILDWAEKRLKPELLALFTKTLQQRLERVDRETSIAQTKRLRNLIRQQGAGSWQRIFESELAALSSGFPEVGGDSSHKICG